jgi:cytidyltransferase-like protein
MTIRVYADICGDLFHAGHVNLLRQARALGDELVVGVMNDADMAGYKHPPILTMAERIAVVAACRYVDQVVPNAPEAASPAYLDALGIDIIVHGDDYTQAQVEKYYGAVRRTHRLVLLPYTPGISTSEIIRRIKARDDL